jgi:capsid protein
MNPKRLQERIDGVVLALSPSWARARAALRVETAQLKYLEAGYESAAGKTQRDGARRPGMVTAEHSPADLSTMIEASCETWRNNSIMSSMARRSADNVVGSGLIVRPTTDGGESLNQDLELSFRAHTSRGGGWEVTNRFSFGQAQRVALFSLLREADFLAYRADAGWQFFEGGQIGTPFGYNNQDVRIYGGCQVDGNGAPAYWWVSDYSKYGYLDAKKAKGLRADKCHHVVNQEFFSGYRGVPVWHNALGRFDDVDRYLEAELLGAMAGACIVGEMNSNSRNPLDALTVDKTKQGAGKSDENHNRHQMAPGMFIRTYVGEKFNMHSPTRPGAPVPEFVRLHLRFLGMPIGMPLELGLMDYTQTNFAAAKMAVLQAALTQLFWRDLILGEMFVQPIYLDWLKNQKDVSVPKTVKRPTAFEIIPPKSAWLEPLKEAQALNEGLKEGWDTITRIAKEEMNRTVQDIFIENADEILLAKKIAVEKGIPDLWREVRHKMVSQKAAMTAAGYGEDPDAGT